MISAVLLWSTIAAAMVSNAASPDPEIRSAFDRDVAPFLEEYCYGCHADGAAEGNLSFDSLRELEDPAVDKHPWQRVLKQLRADLMPPVDEWQPNDEEVEKVERWIIQKALGLDLQHPDPGKVTLRRLNRVEYRNTVRDLLGVDYDTSTSFPADNTGEGFDNIGDVLSMSPLLLEKYFDAAQDIITEAVPTDSGVMAEDVVWGDRFERTDGKQPQDPSEFSYYEPATAVAEFEISVPGDYTVELELRASESYVDNMFDLNRCEFTFSLDGDELLRREFVRQGGKRYVFPFERQLSPGTHRMQVTVQPLSDEEQIRRLRLSLQKVTVRGPDDSQHFVKPEGYVRFFPRSVPEDATERRAYAKELLAEFAGRAFRRPVEEPTLDRLVGLAESIYSDEQATFEMGVAKAMTAILASPRFLFREEFAAIDDDAPYPFLDEFSLASRLSYFLWSSMPDQRLMDLASANQLRENLDAEVERMLADDRADAFVENFVGQWLKARAIESIQIDARSVLRRESPPDPGEEARRKRFFELIRKGDDRSKAEEEEIEAIRAAFRARFRDRNRVELTRDIRRAMRRETEMLFEYIVDNDRSLLELLDSDYTFLNEPLARHYQIDGVDVEGNQMRLVELPESSLRGGILTQGTLLVVTSNPDRTSPVKRGLFILENLLGVPPAAPPPDVPPLEDAAGVTKDGKKRTLRETLAIHRESALCSSCHDTMDPLGLALDNFNAMGRFRDEELGQPIDPAGVLATGEAFETVDELKEILATTRSEDFYRCLTEKMLIYALGRGIEYHDIVTVDPIVEALLQHDGRASTLIYGIIKSDAFQRMRRGEDNPAADQGAES